MEDSSHDIINAQKSRDFAVDVLVKHEKSNESLRAVLRVSESNSRLSRNILSTARYLSLNVMRFLNTIDFILSRSSKRLDVNTLPPDIRQKLRLAIFEMRWDSTPLQDVVKDYFHEEIDYLGVLREARDFDLLKNTLRMQTSNKYSIQFSHPTFLIDTLLKHLGEPETIALLERNNLSPSQYIRVNNLKPNQQDLSEVLQSDGIFLDKVPNEDCIFFLKKGFSKLLKSKYYRESHVIIQDYASILAARCLNAKPGDTVWDVCAAPGMKTHVLEEMLQHQGRLVASDISPQRLNASILRSKKLGSRITQWIRCDATHPCLRDVDKILIDAPCTSTGKIWSHPSYKWRLNRNFLFGMMAIQNKILEGIVEAYQNLPNTEIVYSTCSLLPHEGESQIDSLLARNLIEMVNLPNFGSLGYTDFKCSEYVRRLFPHRHETDGFFIAKFKVKH